jgi:hypothetical protein
LREGRGDCSGIYNLLTSHEAGTRRDGADTPVRSVRADAAPDPAAPRLALDSVRCPATVASPQTPRPPIQRIRTLLSRWQDLHLSQAHSGPHGRSPAPSETRSPFATHQTDSAPRRRACLCAPGRSPMSFVAIEIVSSASPLCLLPPHPRLPILSLSPTASVICTRRASDLVKHSAFTGFYHPRDTRPRSRHRPPRPHVLPQPNKQAQPPIPPCHRCQSPRSSQTFLAACPRGSTSESASLRSNPACNRHARLRRPWLPLESLGASLVFSYPIPDNSTHR